MRHSGLSIKNISTDAISNSWLDFKEGIHTTLTPLGRFDTFTGIAEGLNNPGGDIVLVLGKSEAEPKIDFFLTSTGVYVYAVNLAAESEKGESARSLIEFVWIDVNSVARRIDKRYHL